MFTPGTQPDRVAKTLAAGLTDTLIVDWEDAVAAPDKARARQITTESWPAFPRTRTERAIRVNAPDTEWHNQDIEAAAALAPDAIVIPKAEKATDIDQISHRLWEIESANTIPQNTIRLILILESGRGVLNALSIAEASNRVDAIVFGAEDYQANIGGRRRKDNLDVLWARSHVTAAAAAANVAAIDQVFIDYNDAAGLKHEAETARDLGFSGKMIIHPNQIGVVNDVFTPTLPEMQHAVRVLQAAQAAEKAGKGAFSLDGKMIDRPLILQAQRVLNVARAAGKIP